jgi:hypothetical protein
MPANPHPKRRDFLKTAAAGAAGAMGISALRFDKLFAQTSGGWVSGMQVNPAIDNQRVICCHDPKMLGNYPSSGTVSMAFTSQNSYVDAAVVNSYMDQMAMQLAQKTTAADAWSTIFQKPASKTWANTKVAIKTNAIIATGNHPRVAVIKRICDVLVDQLGVPAANIVLYDANSDASKCYTTYASLTDATKIRAVVSVKAQSLGGQADVTIATATKTMTGVADFVNGVTDILVNVAVLKYHGGPSSAPHPLFGSCSMCMKNHLGTFINKGSETGAGDASATGLHTLEAIIEINKHPAILGGNPVRQQLCIVDCLLANSGNAGGNADARVDRLVMGTFAPIVDYLTAKNVLFNPTAMGGKVVTDYLNNYPKFLTSFDYAETSPLQWIDLGTGGTSTGTGGAGGGGTSAAGGARTGGTSAAGGAGTGGTSGAGGVPSGGTNAAGGASSGGTSGAGGVPSGGTNAAGGANSGGTSAAGGAGTGGTTAAGGTTGSGGTTSGGLGGTGGAATSTASASGGSARTGGASNGGGTGANSTGGSSGTSSATAGHGNSESGCDIAGVDRRATRWGAMLAFGAVVAEKLRRLVSGNDRSS